jgi:hypothetical protein
MTAADNKSTIEILEHQLSVLGHRIACAEREAEAVRKAIYALQEAVPPPPSPTKPNMFYGKKTLVAVKEYMELRETAAGGPNPATVHEVHGDLMAGGFQTRTKDRSTALSTIRNVIYKYTDVFHKLPDGRYGLRRWYPGVGPRLRPVKPAAEDSKVKRSRGRA